MNLAIVVSLIVVVEFYLAAPALGDYTIVLKNGRRMTVQSYREEGTTIKVPALGGELGIPKEQIETISHMAQPTGQELNISDLATSNREAQAVQKTAPIDSSKSKNGTANGDAITAANGQEAKEYQKRLAEVSQKLDMAKEEYYKATQGGGTASNVSKEGLKAWAMDLASRIHDSQKTPEGGSPSHAPKYTAKEKELSNLRIQIDGLQKERDKLINEMNTKKIPTALP
jgi:hypothetical protein